VGLKNWVLYAAKLVAVFKTVIGAKVAPEGTVTVILVAVAAVTVALVAPKNTMLLAAVVLKPVPVRVTVAATLALVGVKEVMVGTCAQDLVLILSPTKIKIKSKICFIKVLLKFIFLLLLWFMIKCFADIQL